MGVESDAAKCLARARELARAGEREQVLQALMTYLELRPRDASVWSNVGGLLLALQRLEEAQEACGKALAIDPRHPAALHHLAETYLRLGRLDESEGLFRRVLAMEPGHLEARLSLGECLLAKRVPEAAQVVLEKALRQAPANLKAHQIQGQILYGQGRWAEFSAELERFGKHAPSSAYLEFERGFENLLRGVMPLGWLQWEARLRVPGCVATERNFAEPQWKGESFPGRTLLVHYEQGFGDTVMLVRFLPEVKARGGRVVLLVQPQFAYLMTTCQGVDQIIPQGDPLPPFDFQVSLFSLPAVLQTDLHSLPAEVPYLGIPQQVPNRQGIAEVLMASEGRVRIGLVWAGNPGHRRDAERSLPVPLLNRLGALPSVAWHGFQLGRAEEPALPGYVSLAPLLSTFSDTAYALSGMDLVITVDTALAHLSGAMGIPTLLLITFAPDFRWMLDRDDSPWYPTMRIFRQPRPGDWDSVMDGLLRELGDGI